jgi:hypothetical protein
VERLADRDAWRFSDGIEVTGREFAAANATSETPLVRLYYEKKAALAREAAEKVYERQVLAKPMSMAEVVGYPARPVVGLEDVRRIDAAVRILELGFDPATIRAIPKPVWPWHLHWLGVIGVALDTVVDPYGAYKRGAQLELDR